MLVFAVEGRNEALFVLSFVAAILFHHMEVLAAVLEQTTSTRELGVRLEDVIFKHRLLRCHRDIV